MSDGNSPLATPTLAERLVKLLPVPYSIGSLLVGFVLLGKLPLTYVYSALTPQISGTPSATVFLAAFEKNDPLFAFYIFSGLLVSCYFYLPHYIRSKLLEAETTVSTLLPKGKEDYRRLFGRVSALKPALLTVIILRIAVEIVFGILPAGSISTWLSNLNTDWISSGLNEFWVNSAISWGLGSLLWTGVSAGIGIRKIGGIQLRFNPREPQLFSALRNIASATVSMTEGYFAIIAVYAGQIAILLTRGAGVSPDWLLISSLVAIGSVLFLPSIARFHALLLPQKEGTRKTEAVVTTAPAPVQELEGEAPQVPFEEATIVGNVSLPWAQITIGKELIYSLDMANIGRGPATLLRLEGLVPAGFKPGGDLKLERDTVTYLDMKGRRLGYLKTFTVKMILQASKTGSWELSPRVLFIAGRGLYRAYQFEPKVLMVQEEPMAGLRPPVVTESQTQHEARVEPTPARLAVGGQDYEGVAIQAQLRTASRELMVGDSFEVNIEVTSVGEKAVILEAIENAGAKGIKPIAAKGGLLSESGRIDLGHLQLQRNEVHNLKLIYSAEKTSETILSPSVTFRTDSGPSKAWQLPQITLSVQKVTPTMEFLLNAFTHDYMLRKLDRNGSGWRSLGEIARGTKIAASQLYGDSRYGHIFGAALETLISGGLIEYRTFTGRGRGGKVLKVRVQYEKEPVKRLVDATLARKYKKP